MDRQVRRMVTQRTGEDSNTVDSAEAVVTAIASDSDEEKNEAVSNINNQSLAFKILFYLRLFQILCFLLKFLERW